MQVPPIKPIENIAGKVMGTVMLTNNPGDRGDANKHAANVNDVIY